MPPEIVWHGVEPAKPDFSYESHSLALALDGRRSDRPNLVDRDIYVAMNAWSEPLGFKIPAVALGPPLALRGRYGASFAGGYRRGGPGPASSRCRRFIACRHTH